MDRFSSGNSPGKQPYLLFLGFMTLFAALAAHAAEPAARERAAVSVALHSGNQAAYAEALQRYNDALTKAFTPVESKPKLKTTAALVSVKAAPRGTSRSPASVVVIKTPPVKAVATMDKSVNNGSNNPVYQDCLKAGPAECCTPILDQRAPMPDSCGALATK